MNNNDTFDSYSLEKMKTPTTEPQDDIKHAESDSHGPYTNPFQAKFDSRSQISSAEDTDEFENLPQQVDSTGSPAKYLQDRDPFSMSTEFNKTSEDQTARKPAISTMNFKPMIPTNIITTDQRSSSSHTKLAGIAHVDSQVASAGKNVSTVSKTSNKNSTKNSTLNASTGIAEFQNKDSVKPPIQKEVSEKQKKKNFITRNIFTNRNQDVLYLKQRHKQYHETSPSLPELPLSHSLPVSERKVSNRKAKDEDAKLKKSKRRDRNSKNKYSGNTDSSTENRNNSDVRSTLSYSSTSSSSAGSTSLRSSSFFSVRSNGGDRKRGIFEKIVEDTKIFIPEKDSDAISQNFDNYEDVSDLDDTVFGKQENSRIRTKYLSFAENYDQDMDSILNAD